MGKKKGRRRKKGGAPNVSRLDAHKRQGKVLSPPLAQLPMMQPVSWMDDRLPELLWAAVLSGNMARDEYLELFRAVGYAGAELGDKGPGPRHSDLQAIGHAEFDQMLGPVLNNKAAKEHLRALLFFDALPDRHHWERHLKPLGPKEALPLLAKGIGKNLFHQSQEATDCRWLRLLAGVLQGKLHLETLPGRGEELIEYPHKGDMRSVRPFIRATEIVLDLPDEGEAGEWPQAFWREGWQNAPCIIAPRKDPGEVAAEEVAKELIEIYHEVTRHFVEVTESTQIDARKDAVFGMVLYSINLAVSLNTGSEHQQAEGRLVIRTIAEVLITLGYLLSMDQDALWAKYRNYGSGQAKLAYLKLIDLDADELPEFVRPEELETLANEDMWQEFTNIDLGSWAGLDLRKMSEQASLKHVYDKYYGWPSGYVHGQWAAVRDTVFEMCLNPLHRAHRVPTVPRFDMGSVARDSIRLVNMLLDLLNKAYPTFKRRMRTGKELAQEPQLGVPTSDAAEEGAVS